MFLLLCSPAGAMSPQEFQQLYQSQDKTADVCYQLYQAFAQGDGVEADKSQARKWLLAAHGSGRLSARKEISELPWRRKAKLKPTIKVAEVSDEQAWELGRELVQFMLDQGGRNLIGMNMLPKEKPARALVSGMKDYIARGADLNVCVTEQNDMVAVTALYLACKMGDASLMDMLINHGADPNYHGGLAMEAFFFPERPESAHKQGDKERKNLEKRARKLFAHLVRKGADVRMWNHVGWSPVYAAVNANSVLGVQMLVKAGADPDQKQNPHEVANHTLPARRINYLTQGYGVPEEETPLNTAAIYARSEVAAALLAAGATPDLPNALGKTPLQRARELHQQLNAKPAAERNPVMEQHTDAILKLLK